MYLYLYYFPFFAFLLCYICIFYITYLYLHLCRATCATLVRHCFACSICIWKDSPMKSSFKMMIEKASCIPRAL